MTTALKKTGTVIAANPNVIESGTLLQERFLIEDTIGAGGMGAVYRATDTKFGTQVAIKQTFYGDNELAAAFEREARLLNGLHHPILPHVSDHFTENGGHFLVMEYIDGEDLSELLKRSEVFPIDTVLGWALELLDGLDYLHSQDPPVIHRDIKPNNLKLTSRGKIVLLDFGMAKETSGNTLGARSVFGYSRRYSPLEQIEGSGTDERSDIFSLGATVYHLLTGSPPADVLARASAIVMGRQDPLLSAEVVNSDVPKPVAEVLDTALALDPNRRYGSARALSNAVQHAMAATEVENASEDAAHTEESETAIGAGMLSGGKTMGASTPQSGGVIREEDVVIPMAPVAEAVHGASAFDARKELRRRLTGMLPGSLPAVHIRRPSRIGYAVGLPILFLCLGFVLYAAYLGLADKDNAPAEVTESVATDTPAAAEAETPLGEEVIEPAAGGGPVQSEEEAVSLQPETDAVDKAPEEANDPVAYTRAEAPITGAEKRAREPKTPIARTRTIDRRTEPRRSAPRRTVRPAFEQPAVSSIERIFTGIPERRRRWETTDSWEERRPRRVRRIMRENQRYRYPF